MYIIIQFVWLFSNVISLFLFKKGTQVVSDFIMCK